MENVGSEIATSRPAERKSQMQETATGQRTGNWISVAALLVLVLLLFNSSLLRGKVAPIWDASDFFGPSFSLVADHARLHRLLLWNPWTAGGSPDFAEPELGTTSPIMILIGLLFSSPWAGFIAYWMLIWIGAGLGMLLFARHLRCPPWGAAVAALGFVASGFFVGHAEHTSSLLSIAFLPWICWRFDDFLITRRYWSAVEAGVLYGLSALGGYPQFTILTPGFLGIWAIGRILFCTNSNDQRAGTLRTRCRSFLGAVLAMLLIGAIGGLIFCPSYLAFATETRAYSNRVGPRSRAESTSSNVLPAGAITTFASPYLFLLDYPGLPRLAWPGSDISMSSIYAGGVVTVLGIMALLSGSRWRHWLAFFALLYLGCALGNQLPLRGWVYDYVPPTRFFRNPSMLSAYSIFILCLLAALGARDLEENTKASDWQTVKFLATSAVLALLAGLCFIAVVDKAPLHTFFPPSFQLGWAHLIIVWIGILLAALMLYSGRLKMHHCAKVLLTLAVFDGGMALLIGGPVMYSSATVGWWQIMNRKHVSNLDLTAQGFSRQLHTPNELSVGVVNNRNVPLKLAVLDSYAPLANRFQLSLVSDPVLREFALGKNRTWFAESALQLPLTDEVFARFVDAAHKQGAPDLILHSSAEMKQLASLPAGPPGRSEIGRLAESFNQLEPASLAAIDLISYRPNSVKFRYEAPKEGWLMITDRWAPGWQAEVNGKPETVYGADFIFRAIKVEAGSNTVSLHYRPRTWLISIVVSWGILLLFSVAALVRWGFNRSSRDGYSSPKLG